MKKFLQAAIAKYRNKRYQRLTASSRRKSLTSGFTLIELLVAALIASLMVAVMLSFLLGVLESDRKETAKSNAQEEIQAAIAYIADDLQESIYIYGAEGIALINDQLPHKQTNAFCTDTTGCTPVLVFWKRNSFPSDTERKYTLAALAAGGTEKMGCMPYKDPSTCKSTAVDTNPYQKAFGREIYTYSLVAYYLKSDVGVNSSTWSNTARLLRWQISDGYPWYCSISGGSITDRTNCPTDKADKRDSQTSSNAAIVPAISDSQDYFIEPDPGFNRPDFSIANTTVLTWKKFSDYNFAKNQFLTLVDLMDDTAYAPNQGGNNDAGTASSATAPLRIAIGKNVNISRVITNPDCDDPSIGVGNVSPVTASNLTGTITQRVPADFTNADGSNPSGLSSFYACVSPTKGTVRIFLRGNAIARLGNPPISRDRRQPTTNNTTFFPTANVRSFGRSGIGLK